MFSLSLVSNTRALCFRQESLKPHAALLRVGLKRWLLFFFRLLVLDSRGRDGLGPHHAEHTPSRPIWAVKQRRARLVLAWVTGWEYRVSKPLFGFRLRFASVRLITTDYTSHTSHISHTLDYTSHLLHYNVARKHAPVERARPLTLFLENDISDSPETLSGDDASCCSRATWMHWISPGPRGGKSQRWWKHRGRRETLPAAV